MGTSGGRRLSSPIPRLEAVPSSAAPNGPITSTGRGAVAIADDPVFDSHRAAGGHPERPERLAAARAGLARATLGGRPRARLDPRDATDAELERVHAPGHVARIGRLAGGAGQLDGDTYFAPDSAAAARRAAGAAMAAARAVLEGQASLGVALVRPPGHHARPDAAMGFCLFNNVAVAAAGARALGAERVLIVDWDVHHGNGTQEIFYEDPGVLFVSLHQAPFYPGTGATDEVGAGRGRGLTLNVPLSAGAGGEVYRRAFDRIVVPAAAKFGPDLVLISAGYDAHASDPLGGMALREDDYAELTLALAAGLPRGLLGSGVVVLEGGYDLRAVSAALQATVEAACGARRSAPETRPIAARHEAELHLAYRAARGTWRI